LKASDISIDHVSDARTMLSVGDSIEVKIVGVDRKTRSLSVSIKAKDIADEQTAVREHREREVAAVTPATLGDLIKQEQDRAASDGDA
jgi:small subunit ribosomal protein S1